MNTEISAIQRQKWKEEIPRLNDGTYDCSIFGGDYVGLQFDFHISGSIALGNHSLLCNVQADGDIYLEDSSDAYEIIAGVNIFIGDYSKIVCLNTNHGNVCVGDFASISRTVSGGSVKFGDSATVLNVSSGGSISFGKNPDISGNLKHKDGIFFEKN